MELQKTIVITIDRTALEIPIEVARTYCPRETRMLELVQRRAQREWQAGELDLRTASELERCQKALLQALVVALVKESQL